MYLKCAYFRGYAQEVAEEIRQFSEGRRGLVQSVQIIEEKPDVTGCPCRIAIWFWDHDR